MSADRLDKIPQHFIDSIEARREGADDNPSRDALTDLLAWAAHLEKLDEAVIRVDTKKERKTDSNRLGNATLYITFERSYNVLADGTHDPIGDWEEISRLIIPDPPPPPPPPPSGGGGGRRRGNPAQK